MAIMHDLIREYLAECVAAARRQGWDGDTYEYTAEDCDYVTGRLETRLGRRPTMTEWREVLGACAYIGDRHCEDYSSEEG
jgi:hypothetical protein